MTFPPVRFARTALLLALGLSSQAVPAVAPAAALPLNQTVQANAYPQLDYFFQRLSNEKLDLVLDGYAPFKSNDKFLPGKVALGLGHVLLHTKADDPRLPKLLHDYRAIADLTVSMDNHTWGIYYYLLSLYQLKQAGLLEQAVSPATLARLRAQLDWRSFVNVKDDYALINLPTNYYGVAFSVARLRMLLGWENESGGTVLLDKMLHHYAAYSGDYGFSDETPGDGRFDRYSILLIAEICERFLETGMSVTPELKAKLRKAADIALNVASPDGEGFSFGRSLGPYGETALLEILAVSAYLDVLTPEEKKYAYAISSRIAERYVNFWFDPDMHSVDLWGKGRRTDTYRGKNRILGENFSLLHQLIATNELWNKAGMQDQVPPQDLTQWLRKARPAFHLTWFAKGEYDRALAIFRDQDKVFSLLMVNGGAGQYANSPYYPLPFAPGIVSGIADSGALHPQLIPKFTLEDGSELMGLAYIKDIQTGQQGNRYQISYRQSELARLGKGEPVKDARISLHTEYTLEQGVITRTDRYQPSTPLAIRKLELEFASFSDEATQEGNKIKFKNGSVYEFEVSGLQSCTVTPAKEGGRQYQAPYGPMKSVVSCATAPFTMKQDLVVKWVMKYQ